MVLTILQVVAQLHLLDRIHHTLHVLRVINAVVVVAKRVQVAVWLGVVILMIRYKLIVLLRWLLSMVALWVVWQRHWFFVILIITFSDTLNDARDSKTNWNHDNKNCNYDYYSCTPTRLWSLIDINNGVIIVIILCCQCLILLSCWIQYWCISYVLDRSSWFIRCIRLVNLIFLGSGQIILNFEWTIQ